MDCPPEATLTMFETSMRKMVRKVDTMCTHSKFSLHEVDRETPMYLHGETERFNLGGAQANTSQRDMLLCVEKKYQTFVPKLFRNCELGRGLRWA